MPGRNTLHLLGAALASSALALAPSSAAADYDAAAMINDLPNCTLFASPTGSDTADGSASAPLQTAQKLVDRLEPGDTGCLREGVYSGGVAFRRSGSESAPITLRSAPGEHAKVVGQVYVADGSNFVTVADLELDGTHPQAKPSPMVNGDNATFVGNDISSTTETCFVLGDKVWGVPSDTVIVGNDIHHCGVNGTNQDHGVYVRQAVGTVIEDNAIRDNPDRGVQFWPNGDDSVVRGNVIDGNGQGVQFSGDSVETSDGNLIDGNLITNSDLGFDLTYYWTAGRIGSGNVVRANCIWGGLRGRVKTPLHGFFDGGGNLLGNPLYLLRGLLFTLAPTSPCPVAPPVLP